MDSGRGFATVDGYKPSNTLRTLNYENHGIFLIMGHAGFISSAVRRVGSGVREPKQNPDPAAAGGPGARPWSSNSLAPWPGRRPSGAWMRASGFGFRFRAQRL